MHITACNPHKHLHCGQRWRLKYAQLSELEYQIKRAASQILHNRKMFTGVRASSERAERCHRP